MSSLARVDDANRSFYESCAGFSNIDLLFLFLFSFLATQSGDGSWNESRFGLIPPALLSLLRNSARGERWQVSRNHYLPCVSWNFFFLTSSSFFSLLLQNLFGFHFNISICFTFHYQICSRLVGGSSQRLHYRGIYKRQALSFSCVCVCMCAVGNFRATGFPHQTPSVSSLFLFLPLLAHLLRRWLFRPFFPSSFEREERRKKKSSKKCGKVLFSFHPTLSISVSRLKSLIEVLQPASRPATRRKKCIDRNRLSVSFCTILFLLLLSLTNYFFFSLLLSTEPPVRPNRFFFISKAGSLLSFFCASSN